MPLLQQEQKRILGERAQAEGIAAALAMERDTMQWMLDAALDKVRRCDEVYFAGSPQLRRELCFALFTRIYVSQEGVVGADLATPYAQILAPDLEAQIQTQRESISAGRLGEASPPRRTSPTRPPRALWNGRAVPSTGKQESPAPQGSGVPT